MLGIHFTHHKYDNRTFTDIRKSSCSPTRSGTKNRCFLHSSSAPLTTIGSQNFTCDLMCNCIVMYSNSIFTTKQKQDSYLFDFFINLASSSGRGPPLAFDLGGSATGGASTEADLVLFAVVCLASLGSFML